MPTPKDKKRIEVHLSPDEYKVFKADAERREWSDKKLAENIVKWYLKSEVPVDLKVPLSRKVAKD